LAWQVAQQFSDQIHNLTVRRWQPTSRVAFDQLRRAALSARINITEGYGRRTPRQFAHFLTIAYGSALESGDLLEFCVEVNLLTEAEATPPLELVHRLEALVIRLRHHVLQRGNMHN
jgi:four helix bundle protein